MIIKGIYLAIGFAIGFITMSALIISANPIQSAPMQIELRFIPPNGKDI